MAIDRKEGARSDADQEMEGCLDNAPLNLIVIGMAGSGKTTFIQRLRSHFRTNKLRPYIINLDPAVDSVAYKPNIDIRETIDYHSVMKRYELGPNGGIITSMNLFATKFSQVLEILERRKDSIDYVILDTPGQIEVFAWSASGSIITQCLGASGPTAIVYIVDTPRATSPVTFMSNMLYACSVLYKMQLPFILVFNKIDVISHRFAINWMEDFESFHEALQDNTTYMATLTGSMSLVLEEFYNNLRAVGVSSVTGQGMNDLLATFDKAREEYIKDFLPEIKQRIKKEKENHNKKVEENLSKLMKDLDIKPSMTTADSKHRQSEKFTNT